MTPRSMRGSPIDIATRTKRNARELRLDIETERRWNRMHPNEDPLTAFSGLNPELGDRELLDQLMAQENSRAKE